jgi:hypothetical protein
VNVGIPLCGNNQGETANGQREGFPMGFGAGAGAAVKPGKIAAGAGFRLAGLHWVTVERFDAHFDLFRGGIVVGISKRREFSAKITFVDGCVSIGTGGSFIWICAVQKVFGLVAQLILSVNRQSPDAAG